MSRIAKSVLPAASSFGASVERGRLADGEGDPVVVVVALVERAVDPRVHRVRLKVEHERRLV